MAASTQAPDQISCRFRAVVMGSIGLAIGLLAAVEAYADDAPRPSPPPPGEALVYIYRAPAFAYGYVPALFDIDKVNVAKLNNKDYTWFYVPAGAHVLRQHWGGLALVDFTQLYRHNDGVFDWNGGSTYYYRMNVSFSITYARDEIDWGLSPIEEAQALRELAVYRYVAAHDLERLKANPALLPAGVPAAAAPSSTSEAPAARTGH